MKLSSAFILALGAAGCNAFQPTAPVSRRSVALNSAGIADDTILAQIKRLIVSQDTPAVNSEFDATVQSKFPGAIPNNELESKVVDILDTKGYSPGNTLLATSLCCDELARKLEDDFVKIYGDNFSLGGLSGFPFAGNTGFGAMAAHIPDDGYCLIVYGPHVGVSQDGTVGKVERKGIELVDTCCGSAVAASNYLKGITEGGASISTNIQTFTDFQQGAVQELILPHGKRLTDAKDLMVELPYALFESQDMLMKAIVDAGASGTKKGLAMLGGIQINTGPDTPDYFHPLRFDYMNNSGEIVEDMLPRLTGENHRSIVVDKAAPIAAIISDAPKEDEPSSEDSSEETELPENKRSRWSRAWRRLIPRQVEPCDEGSEECDVSDVIVSEGYSEEAESTEYPSEETESSEDVQMPQTSADGLEPCDDLSEECDLASESGASETLKSLTTKPASPNRGVIVVDESAIIAAIISPAAKDGIEIDTPQQVEPCDEGSEECDVSDVIVSEGYSEESESSEDLSEMTESSEDVRRPQESADGLEPCNDLSEECDLPTGS